MPQTEFFMLTCASPNLLFHTIHFPAPPISSSPEGSSNTVTVRPEPFTWKMSKAIDKKVIIGMDSRDVLYLYEKCLKLMDRADILNI